MGYRLSENQALFWHRNVREWTALSLVTGMTVSAICAVSAAGTSVLLMFLPSTGNEISSGKRWSSKCNVHVFQIWVD